MFYMETEYQIMDILSTISPNAGEYYDGIETRIN